MKKKKAGKPFTFKASTVHLHTISRRDYFAGCALGNLANGAECIEDYKKVAETARRCADFLVEELDKKYE